MNTLLKCAAGLFAASFLVAAHAAPPVVSPEPMDLDADLNAKIMMEKARRGGNLVPAGNGQSSSSSNCGQVNINSNQNSDKKSISGLQDMFGKQSTTIVTGPVINMANCK
jgi:hypothetical protein